MLTEDAKLENSRLREIAMRRLLAGGATIEETCDIVRKMYISDKEDFTDDYISDEVLLVHSEHLGDKNKQKRSIHEDVENWLHSNKSNKPCYGDVTVSLQACYGDLGLKTPNEKASCRMAFKRLMEKGNLEPLRKQSGMYRYINAQMEELDFLNADVTPFDIRFPLGVHELVEI